MTQRRSKWVPEMARELPVVWWSTVDPDTITPGYHSPDGRLCAVAVEDRDVTEDGITLYTRTYRRCHGKPKPGQILCAVHLDQKEPILTATDAQPDPWASPNDDQLREHIHRLETENRLLREKLAKIKGILDEPDQASAAEHR